MTSFLMCNRKEGKKEIYRINRALLQIINRLDHDINTHALKVSAYLFTY